jgi:hypothetical protein
MVSSFFVVASVVVVFSSLSPVSSYDPGSPSGKSINGNGMSLLLKVKNKVI